MVQSIYNGYSGVKTHQMGVDSISGNISNINTNGFRGTEAKFETIFATSMDSVNSNSPVSSDKNYGVTLNSNNYSTQMGSLVSAESSDFNMALTNENGWFKVGNSTGTEIAYTRDGSFNRDVQGFIVNGAGNYLYGVNLGKIANSEITPSADKTLDLTTLKNSNIAGTAPMQIPETLRYPPKATTYINNAVNLDVNTAFKDASLVSNYNTANISTVYGNGERLVANKTEQVTLTVAGVSTSVSLANANNLDDVAAALSAVVPTTVQNGKLVFTNNTAEPITFDYAKSSENTMKALGFTSDKVVGAGTYVESSTLQIPSVTFQSKVFDAQGNQSTMNSKYTLVSKDGVNERWQITSSVGTNAETTAFLSFNGVNPETPPTLYDADGVTEINNMNIASNNGAITYNPKSFTDKFGDTYHSTNTYDFTNQYVTDSDGVAEGYLKDVSVDSNGIISINFTNGESELYGRVAVARFSNDEGLSKAGGNLFVDTANSGGELTGWTANGLTGTGIAQHMLETSNVKMDRALTELIIMQRGYSANTKTITASDEMIKEAIGLKR